MPDIEQDRPCSLCGGRRLPALNDVADSLTGERFAIHRCLVCGVGQTVPVPDDLSRYYQGYHGNRHGVTAGYCVWRRLRLLRRIAGEGGGRRLLDVGCGDGGFLLAAQRSGWQVAGTEIEPRRAASRGLDVRCDVGDFEAHERCECVTFWHSLEHLRRPADALRFVYERLRPGGSVIIAVPDAGGWQARVFGRHWLHLDVPRHLFHFDRRSLRRMLETTGFALVGSWHQEIEYDLIGWSQSALNAAAMEPNIFFNTIIHKPVRSSRFVKAVHLAAGSLLTAAAVPLALASSAAGRGGTLIAAATKPASESNDAVAGLEALPRFYPMPLHV